MLLWGTWTMKIKFQSRSFLVLAGALVATAVMIGFNEQPNLAVTFQGWTNVAGQTHALVSFPKVKERSAGTKLWDSLCKTHYQLRVDFESVAPDGLISSGIFEESGGNTRSVGTSIRFPGTASLRLAGARSQLLRYWDNIELPIPPPRPQWVFAVPAERQMRANFENE